MERYFYHPTAEQTPVPRQYPGAESVWFDSSDGTRLHGWFIPAWRSQSSSTQTNQANPSPTILHVHGNAGSIASHAYFTEYLPPAGFNVFIFDYRGYGQSEGSARRRAPLIADTHAALDALLLRSDVDPLRIGMYGQSLGATIGVNVMATRPEIRAAVLESPFVSWREMAACAVGGERPNLFCRALATTLIPDTHRADEAIAQVQRPMLLLHGSSDSIVPASHSRTLHKAARGHATLVELPGGDHNTLRDTHPEIEGIAIEFFRRALAETDAPATAD